jgi:hypothetical protein
VGGVDPGRQLVTVVRKGTGELQQLPASSDGFVWLRLYQVEMEGLIPTGRRQPLWWTLRDRGSARRSLRRARGPGWLESRALSCRCGTGCALI